MSAFPRLALARALLFVVVFVAFPARAWVEKRFTSDSVTLDLERDGSAIVEHEMLLFLRGGPLHDITIDGVDADAALLPGATATLAKSGQAAGLPVTLTPSMDGSRVRLHVEFDRGLRSGTYQVRFRYRTQAGGPGRVSRGPLGALLEWSGPQLGDGVDSARVVFRIPRAAAPPRLPSSPAGDRADVVDDRAGVFLSTLRRAADKDELEVVRPHVAKGEVVTWRVVLDPGALQAPSVPEVNPAPADPALVAPAPLPAVASRRRPSAWPIASGLGVALAFAALVVLKARAVRTACERRRAIERPILPATLWLRATLAGACLAGAGELARLGMLPLVSVAALILSMAAVAYLPAQVPLARRGPGQWVRVDPSLLEEEEPRGPRFHGRFLDAGHPLGFVVFVSALMGLVAAAITRMPHSPYQGVALGLGSAILFPLFFTGRASDLPPLPEAAARDLVAWMMGELGKDPALLLKVIVRVPHGSAVNDEIRLHVLPERRVVGVVALEVGVDLHRGLLGALPTPFVIVRAVDGSPASEALPKGLLWTRGRTADERVAVVRPKVPTRTVTATLVRELARRLSPVVPEPRRQSTSSMARSSGSGQATAKLGTTVSPAHST